MGGIWAEVATACPPFLAALQACSAPVIRADGTHSACVNSQPSPGACLSALNEVKYANLRLKPPKAPECISKNHAAAGLISPCTMMPNRDMKQPSPPMPMPMYGLGDSEDGLLSAGQPQLLVLMDVGVQ